MIGRAALVTTLAAGLAACGSAPQPVAAPRSAPVVEHLSGVPALLAGSRDLGPTRDDRAISLTLALPDRHAAARRADAVDRSTPGGPSYQRFLTPRQAARRFGPDLATVRRVRRQLTAHGLVTSWSPGSAWVDVHATLGAVRREFALDVHEYVAPSGRFFYATRSAPAVPADLRGDVIEVAPVLSYPLAAARPRHAADVPPGGLSPDQLLAAYHADGLRTSGLDGSGETVVFIEIDGFDQRDLDAYSQEYHLSAITPKERLAAQPAGSETPMDLEVVHAVAPGAALVLYTLDPSTADISHLIATMEQAVADNPRAVHSYSIGVCERALAADAPELRRLDDVLATAAQQGETIFAATGDQGGYECPTQDWGEAPSASHVGVWLPAAAPGVTAVGGTHLDVRQDGSYLREAGWTEPARTVGTGGGISERYRKPSWQDAPGVTAASAEDSRLVPDISADADPGSGIRIHVDGDWTQGGGTSMATPIWAGLAALFDQSRRKQGKGPLGDINPALYAVARGPAGAQAFHDVTVGGNLLFDSAPGYDLGTGLGSPDAERLRAALDSAGSTP